MQSLTEQSISSLVGALGFPIFLIVAGLFIFVRYLWPWFVADQKQRRETEQARHADYIGTYKQNAESQRLLTDTLIEFSTLVKAQHDQQSETTAANHGTVINVIEKNHTDLVKRLDNIDRKIPSGFGVK